MDTFLKDALSRLAGNPIRWNCPLSGYTSFSIGGPAEALITVEGSGELQDLLSFFRENDLPWRVIGRGTNLLVSDSGFDGVIVVLGGGFMGIGFEDDGTSVRVRVGGGCGLTRLSGWCIKNGLSGLEFACGIPGTVGGAVVMNAGAWGNELADVLASVTVMTADGPKEIERRDLHFSYRCWQDHAGGGEEQVVTEAEVRLLRADPDILRRRCSELIARRRAGQPKGQPNAGSFFKNPPGESAGRLIEKSGCKGMRVGGAMVSPVHANFLVNTGGATAEDVKELMERVREMVLKDSGIMLDPEVHFV